MNKIIIYTLITIIAITIIFVLQKGQISSIEINGNVLKVEIADNPEEHRKGLSGRSKLDKDGGMFFIFDSPIIPQFWMKDMQFPIDIIWINENFQILDIAKNISPNSFPKTFSPPQLVLYVLEVNAGWSEKNNISVGSKIIINN